MASRVVNGESSETLLDAYSGDGAPWQVVQRDESPPATSRNEEYSGLLDESRPGGRTGEGGSQADRLD
ncbi:MAG TPA: hypothetical protein VHZ07_09835 [Bryobacteraceae bacterium]|nr:hypothetical protein [Bryobacteraceae bacterium]